MFHPAESFIVVMRHHSSICPSQLSSLLLHASSAGPRLPVHSDHEFQMKFERHVLSLVPSLHSPFFEVPHVSFWALPGSHSPVFRQLLHPVHVHVLLHSLVLVPPYPQGSVSLVFALHSPWFWQREIPSHIP